MIFVHSKVSDGNMINPQIRKKFLSKFENVVEVQQIHSKKIVTDTNANIRADGIITNKKGIYLVVKTADCIPIALYNHKAIGLIHAGLKGLEKGIIKHAINKMKKHFQADPKDLEIKFGPSIGPCCYKKDIWQMAENQLIENGVLKENIDNPRICTYENKNYFSNRRACDLKTEDGRFVTILGL